MRNEEALNNLKFEIDEECHCDYLEEEIRVAIQALEKQIPKKPITKEIYNFDPMGKIYTWKHYLCENCGENIGIKINKYCPECGQAIDWSNDNGNV